MTTTKRVTASKAPVYGRQETWEDSPSGWLRQQWTNPYRTRGLPIVQWLRVQGGHSDDLTTGAR